MNARLPTESVDAFAGVVRDDEAPRTRARNLFRAAAIVAGAAWLATMYVAATSSETNGVYASWFAVFPTGFSLGGLHALARGRSAGRAVVQALVVGGLACLSLAVFFAAIWPAL
jgi:peptidoglycan/LPS O-acetylase OafA/YrhL